MKIVNYISNFFINNHLLELDINNDFIGFILIFAIVYFCVLFLYGIINGKISKLYVLLQLVYCILNVASLLFFCGLLVYLLGNAGVITFCIFYIIYCIIGIVKLFESGYIFNIGNIPKWICDNYETKRKFYTELNNEYQKFKQYNEEII